MGKTKDTSEILKTLKKYIGEGGMVAFEHGFKRPTFKLSDGSKYKCTMVSDKVMYGFKCYVGSCEKRTCNYPLSTLSYTVLNSLYKAMLKYEDYCKNEVV